MRRIRPGIVLVLAAALAAALIAVGCGSGDEGAAEGGAATGEGLDATTATADAGSNGKIPAPLAENRAEANEILEDGSLEPKLSDLRGHPVVVNQWASWCEPCRAEFPYFRDAAASHAGDVAFLGIDMQDDRGAAEEFLAELPVPYPSVFDPSARQIASLGGGIVSPTTVFIDERGTIVEVFQGAYSSRAQLEADIDRYLLAGRT